MGKTSNKKNYLQGLESNKLGRPISLENVTTVPVGPITYLMEFDGSVNMLAAFSCIKYSEYKMELLAFYRGRSTRGEGRRNISHSLQYLCQFFLALLYLVFTLLPAGILTEYFSNSLSLHNSITKIKADLQFKNSKEIKGK